MMIDLYEVAVEGLGSDVMFAMLEFWWT